MLRLCSLFALMTCCCAATTASVLRDGSSGPRLLIRAQTTGNNVFGSPDVTSTLATATNVGAPSITSSDAATASVPSISSSGGTTSSNSSASSSEKVLNGVAAIFTSGSPYFAAAIAVVAIISFLLTLLAIAVLQCIVRRHRRHQQGVLGTPRPSRGDEWLEKSHSRRSSKTDITYKQRADDGEHEKSPLYQQCKTAMAPTVRCSSPYLVNGHLAPSPPRYEPVALTDDSCIQHQQESLRRSPTIRMVHAPRPCRPLPSATPPYVDGPRGPFLSPRPAPSPPSAAPSPAGRSPFRGPGELQREINSNEGSGFSAFRSEMRF